MHEAAQRRDEEGRVVRRGLTPEEFEAQEALGFELPNRALLHQRIRYFTDGLALGSEAFVNEVFRKTRRTLGVKRKVGARVPRLAGLGELRTLKDLRGEMSGWRASRRSAFGSRTLVLLLIWSPVFCRLTL